MWLVLYLWVTFSFIIHTADFFLICRPMIRDFLRFSLKYHIPLLMYNWLYFFSLYWDWLKLSLLVSSRNTRIPGWTTFTPIRKILCVFIIPFIASSTFMSCY
jgi:hypothetical protein